MALRWGFTEGAYNKYAHYFSKELPISIHSTSPISTAAHIRDVIKYAYQHKLKGGELYKQVKVSAQEGDIVLIYARQSANSSLPTHNIFELMCMLDGGEGMPHGYKAHVSDGVPAVMAMKEGFPQYHFVHLHSDVVEFSRVGGLL